MSDSPQQHEGARSIETRHKVGGVLLAGCLGVLVIGTVIAVIGITMFTKGRAELTPIVRELLELVERRQYEQAYDAVGDEWRKAQTFEQFHDMMLLVSHALGPVTELSTQHVGYQRHLGAKPRALIVVQGTFEKADAVLHVTLFEYEDGWRVDGLTFNSDAIEAALACPHCGTRNGYDARHCSHCGDKIVRPSEEPRRDAA